MHNKYKIFVSGHTSNTYIPKGGDNLSQHMDVSSKNRKILRVNVETNKFLLTNYALM